MKPLAIPVFERLGIKVVGCFNPIVGDDENCLIYLLGYEDIGARQRAWEQFWVDPEWTNGRAALTQKFGGPIVAKNYSVFLQSDRLFGIEIEGRWPPQLLSLARCVERQRCVVRVRR
jgi:hypothetical protein